MITEDQLHFLLGFILIPFYVTVLISLAGFYFTYNQPMVMWKKLLVNITPVVLVIAIVASSAPFYPTGTNRILIAVKTAWYEDKHLGIVTGFVQGRIEENVECLSLS